ncbi:MAG: NUDIX domain-containing protein [Prevotella sp.]|jgi:8-oxo-dGTP diphosphatase
MAYTYKYPHPAVAADCVVFGHNADGATMLLLIERKNEPCKGQWAFPGGFMNIDETADDAARRELQEETGLHVTDVHQIGAFTAVDRDPRERVLSVAFWTDVEGTPEVKGGDDAKRARWFPITALPPLAFDHAEILQRALYLKKKGVE